MEPSGPVQACNGIALPLHIVMIIQFNFENNTQIPSVKVCIHFFGGLCIFVRILVDTQQSEKEKGTCSIINTISCALLVLWCQKTCCKCNAINTVI